MKKRPAGKRRIGKRFYRGLLLDKKKDLLSHLGASFDTLANPGRVNEEDQAQLSHDEFITLHLSRLDYELLRQVEDALHRLGRGEYGTCLECGEPIAENRLRAVPWAMFCVRCQERVGEREEAEPAEVRRR